jgi:MFS family permease
MFSRRVRIKRLQPCDERLKLIPPSRIRFGRYQWQLFILTGLGWLADSEMKVACVYVTCLWSLDMWFQGLAVALPQVQQELNPVRVEYAVLAEFAGLIVGATTWGILADVIGRRLSFNVRRALKLCVRDL